MANRCAATAALLLLTACLIAKAETPPPGKLVDVRPDKVHPRLAERLANEPGPAKAWIFFTDKGFESRSAEQAALAQVAAEYNPRAKWRRAIRGDNSFRGGATFGWHDLPLSARYLDAVRETGAKIHVESTWLNAVSAYVTVDQLNALAALPCVDRLEAVARTRRIKAMNVTEVGPGPFPTPGKTRAVDYGNATAQLNQMNLPALHDAGYTGQGVIIGILDTGFRRTHQAFNHPIKPVDVIASTTSSTTTRTRGWSRTIRSTSTGTGR
jgi:hypothetical protein